MSAKTLDGATTFVGRGPELDKLREVLVEATQGQGKIVFIKGEPGEGKTELLEALERRSAADPTLQAAKFATVNCYEESGTNDAYQPFAEILRALTDPKDTPVGRDRLKKVMKILKEVAPQWLDIVPGLGIVARAAKAIGRTADVSERVFHGSGDEHYAKLTYRLDTEYAKAIDAMVSVFPLLVLVIEDCQWIDASSCQLFFRLSRGIRKQHVVIIATCRSAAITKGHPLESLIEETRMKDIAQVFELKGLSVEEIEQYNRNRFGNVLDKNLAPWLEYLCKGNPLILTQYLSLLEQEKIIRPEGSVYIFDGEIKFSSSQWELSNSLLELPIPDRVDAVLERRIQLLSKEIIMMLKIASVQGERFMSTVLGEVLRQDERNVMDQLGPVIEQHRLISEFVDEEWVARRSAVYIFEHALLQKQFYKKLNQRERALYHSEVAESLTKAINEMADPPRKLLLDVARHADLGGDAFLSARLYWRAAQSTFSSGAFSETTRLCELALERMHNRRPNPEESRLRAEITLLLLSASEVWWHGKPEGEWGALRLQELVGQAEKAAAQAQDALLLSRAKFLKGSILVTTGSHTDAVAALQDALDTAKRAGDSLGEVMIMSRLGHIMSTQLDLNQGVGLLHEAHKLFEARRETSRAAFESFDFDRDFFQLKGRVGIGEFDRGNFGSAVAWIGESIAGLERLKTSYELAWTLSHLGQVFAMMGRFEDSETALQRAIALHKTEEGALPVRANSLAELGKLYLEWGRLSEAVDSIRKAWDETEKTWMTAIVPIARNYYAELLMHPDSPIRDLNKAEEHLSMALKESREYSLRRSTIVALSLWGQLLLMRKEPEAAFRRSAEAVAELERTGIEPHVREEEIFFNHFLVLRSVAREQDANEYLEKASKVLRGKAMSIPDPESRQGFLTRVRVSQQILSNLNQSTP